MAASSSTVSRYGEELEHRAITLAAGKMVHINVVRNTAGPVLKLAVSNDRRRTTVQVPGVCVAQFADELAAITEEESKMAAFSRDDVADDEIVSKRVQGDLKTIYLDIRENEYGRYLRITELRRDAERQQIIVACEALGLVSDAVTGIVDRHTKFFSGAAERVRISDGGRRQLVLARGENSFGEFVTIAESSGPPGGGGGGGGGRGRGRGGSGGGGGRGGRGAGGGAGSDDRRIIMSLSMARKLHAELGKLIDA
jgi:uncharacterized membrane protein YgcG